MVFITFGVLGLIVGSFLNVVILRSGARSLTGRSACLSCGREIAPYDLIPVFSWLALRGRCRFCGSRISAQYPLVEAITGVTFALIAGIPDLSLVYRALFCCIASILICIAVYDIAHTIILDQWAYTFAALSFVVMAPLLLQGSQPSALLYTLGGPITAAPLFVLWFVSQGRWMGLGDPKLALGIGWLLGPYVGLSAVFSAFVLGAIFAVCILIPLSALRAGAERITMKSEVPFGPFLIVSAILLWLMVWYGVDLSFFPWL